MPPSVDFLAPRYLLRVEGTKLESDVTDYVTEVEFEEEEDAASKITIRVANVGFRFLDSKVFAEGNHIDLWMGYRGKALEFMQRGTIVRPDPDFPRSGVPTMTVVAHDESRRLMDVLDDDKGQTYQRMRDSEIAEKIFASIGAGAFVYRTDGIETRSRKRGTSRWEFLRDLAFRHDFKVSMRYDPTDRAWVGYFGPPGFETQTEKYSLPYGTGEDDALLLDFHPRMSLEGQAVKVKMQFTSAKSKKSRLIEVDVSSLARKARAEKTRFTAANGTDKLAKPLKSGPAVVFTVLGERFTVMPDRRFHSPKEARHFATAWFRALEEEFVLGSGSTVGIAKLRRGQVHELTGLGPRLSGDWRIVSTRHRMGGSSFYETEFNARRVPLDRLTGSSGNVAAARATESPL